MAQYLKSFQNSCHMQLPLLEFTVYQTIQLDKMIIFDL
jgi:hypothetical protein